MQRLITSALSLAFLASMTLGADAKACRDAKGHFMKCPPPMAHHMMMTQKKKMCRDAKGHFMKCAM